MRRTPFSRLGAILFKEFIIIWRDTMTLDLTVETRQSIDRFVNTETFRVVGEVQRIGDMASRIRGGRAYAGLQIPPKFTERLRNGQPAQVQLLIDGSNSTTALQALNTALAVALTQSVEALMRESGRRDVPIDIRPQMLYNPTMRSPKRSPPQPDNQGRHLP